MKDNQLKTFEKQNIKDFLILERNTVDGDYNESTVTHMKGQLLWKVNGLPMRGEYLMET